MVAVGGYGRREQCRHSDLDVMLLVARRSASDEAKDLLYPLWDSGLKVGHSVRTPDQAIEALDTLENLTALIDSRLVAGDAELFGGFRGRLADAVARRRRALAAGLRTRRADLTAREPWQLQEPDLKTGRGGLRALNAVHWLNASSALADGRPEDALPPELIEARETLLATRHALHALGERPNDRYLRPLVRRATDWLGEDPLSWGRRLLAAMRRVDAAEASMLGSAPDGRRPGSVTRVLSSLVPWSGRAGGDDREPADPSADPAMSDLDRLFRAIEGAGGESLEPLPESEWAARLIPEWDHLRCLPHEALFHSHPVDIHAWRTVEEVAFAMREDSERTGTVEAAEQAGDRRQLLLAALLHDMGKGHEGDHSQVGAVIAERVAARAGLDPETGWRLAQAVRHHLLIPNVATRRDIADAKVIRETAATVRDARMLHLLYVLSVADSRASGPDVWSPWRAQLMRTLYLRVLSLLQSQHPAGQTATTLQQEIETTLAGTFDRTEVRAHLEGLPANYVLSMSPDVVGTHMRLIFQASGGTAVDHDLAGQVDRLTVVTPDRPGILALVAGTLAVHNVNVLGGTAFTRGDGVAIEVFYVGDALGHGIDERRWGRVMGAIPEALDGRLDVEGRLAETRRAYRTAAARLPIESSVIVDNVASEAYSIVEVNTSDRLGLLYSITQALRGVGLNIHLAKVDTIGPEVVDAFYVQTAGGGRLEGASDVEAVKEAVLAAVRALDAPP